MRICNRTVAVAFLLLAALPSLARAGSSSNISPRRLDQPAAPQKVGVDFWEDPSYPEPPEYVKNWEFGLNFDEDERLRYFADLILPLYRTDSEDRTLFFEPVVHHAEAETLLNLGLGYRSLVLDRSWMLGGNLFLDAETQYSHKRVGVGLEALSSYAEFRGNGYWGVTGQRTVQQSDSAKNEEIAADGFDLELGAPVPYYSSRLKLFGGYERYNFRKFKDREGWWARMEVRPIPALVLDFTLRDHNKRSTGWGMTIALRPPFWDNEVRKAKNPLKPDPVMFLDDDVGDRLYTPVERHHEIVVESFSQSNGQITVEITRGN